MQQIWKQIEICFLADSSQTKSMNTFVILKQPRIIIDQIPSEVNSLTLKVGMQKQIYRCPGFKWNKMCSRWDSAEDIRIAIQLEEVIEFQVFYEQFLAEKSVVIAEGWLKMSVILGNPCEEIKIPLSYDSINVGWMYMEIRLDGKESQEGSKQTLFLNKVKVDFLEEKIDDFNFRVFQNQHCLFENDFNMINKTISFPINVMIKVKLSDVITFKIQGRQNSYRKIDFRIDNIKRGKSTAFQAWIRNNLKNRVGDLEVQYFLENIYLENQRKLFTKKALFPQVVIKTNNDLQSKDNASENVIKSRIIKKLDDADKKINLMNLSITKLINEISSKQNKIQDRSQSHGLVINERIKKLKNKESDKKREQKLKIYSNQGSKQNFSGVGLLEELFR